MFGAGGAVVGHAHRVFDELVGKRLNPFPVEGELVIIEVDVPGSEPLLEMADMRHHVVGGVVPETASENRPVAVGAGVGTAATGDATRIRDARVVENRQGIGGGISVELLIGRKGEFIQNELMIAVSVKDRGCLLYTSDAADE